MSSKLLFGQIHPRFITGSISCWCHFTLWKPFRATPEGWPPGQPPLTLFFRKVDVLVNHFSRFIFGRLTSWSTTSSAFFPEGWPPGQPPLLLYFRKVDLPVNHIFRFFSGRLTSSSTTFHALFSEGWPPGQPHLTLYFRKVDLPVNHFSRFISLPTSKL